MQKSRKALLQRRDALEKGITGRNHLYKVSLTLVFLLWGLIFLLNSLISRGDGYRVCESSWHEASLDPNEGSVFGDASAQSNATSGCNDQNNPITVGEAAEHSTGAENISDVGSKANRETPVKSDRLSHVGSKANRETPVKSDRLSRVAPPGLDEFRSKAINVKERHISRQTGTVIHRIEPGGKEYNYASATKGAKVLAFNKEAKGPSNILDRDKDKYLRNPCSAEGKYVVIELSEETLVDTIEIANFEHYSSNLKGFELLSSLTYPTDNWVELGNFTAGNVKHAQRFALAEPKWARYLKLNLLSHYGSEFYCTLSMVEVYGVDAVERMLEDLISVENRRLEPEEQNVEQQPLEEPAEGDDLCQELFTEMDESPKKKLEMPRNNVLDPVVETRPPQVGRIPGDTVLKILMQKVQSLDVNFSVLERYLEELNSRYRHIFKEFDDDIAYQVLLLEKIRSEIMNLENSNDIFARDIGELLSWKSLVSSQMDQLVKDSAILRSEVARIHDHQADLDNSGLAVIFVSFVFGCIAASKLFIGMVLVVCRTCDLENFCRTTSAWLALLLSSVIIAFILVL